MNVQVQKVWAGMIGYGLVRNSLVATQIPMEKNELYTGRAMTIILASSFTPIYLPMLVAIDLSNIERCVRKMPLRHEVPFIN